MLPFLTQWQSVVVNGSIQYRKSWTNRHSTSTSHKYLFSTFLPASAFIYWLFLVTLYDWVEIADTQKEHKRMSQPVDGRTLKEKGIWMEGHFLVCFYIPRELPSPTTRIASHYSGLFFWSEGSQMEEEKKENWAKERKERLNSVLRDIT